jgi:hypothetical protein
VGGGKFSGAALPTVGVLGFGNDAGDATTLPELMARDWICGAGFFPTDVPATEADFCPTPIVELGDWYTGFAFGRSFFAPAVVEAAFLAGGAGRASGVFVLGRAFCVVVDGRAFCVVVEGRAFCAGLLAMPPGFDLASIFLYPPPALGAVAFCTLAP